MTTIAQPASVRIKRQPSRANVGLILEFPDGHTASLSYSEIEALQNTGR